MIKNLVFAGGSSYVEAYVGALVYLAKNGCLKDVHRYAGTSAGAMIACLLAAGYDVSELHALGAELNQHDIVERKGMLRDAYHLCMGFGVSEGNVIRSTVLGLLEKKLLIRNPTFADLPPGVQLVVVGTNITKRKRILFSRQATPTMSIADAVSISTRLPLVFKPWTDKNGDHLVDGGVSDNYPLEVFDAQNVNLNETLGLRTAIDVSNRPPARNIAAYLAQVINSLCKSPETIENELPQNQRRTMKITVPLVQDSLKISDAESRALYASGSAAAKSYCIAFADTV